jgi:hypothetical protein
VPISRVFPEASSRSFAAASSRHAEPTLCRVTYEAMGQPIVRPACIFLRLIAHSTWRCWAPSPAVPARGRLCRNATTR